jgi:hypothetical protein
MLKDGGSTVIKCPNCGNDNDDDAKICVYCGNLLVDPTLAASTRTLDDTDFEEGVPKWGSARFNARTNLILGIEEDPRTLIFDATDITELVMGRVDPKTGEAPEVDLTEYDAIDKGVSRRHAAVVRKDGSLYLVDMSSANGTFLNGQKLVPQQPRVLRDGDDIRLGHLTVRITFERA